MHAYSARLPETASDFKQAPASGARKSLAESEFSVVWIRMRPEQQTPKTRRLTEKLCTIPVGGTIGNITSSIAHDRGLSACQN